MPHPYAWRHPRASNSTDSTLDQDPAEPHPSVSTGTSTSTSTAVGSTHRAHAPPLWTAGSPHTPEQHHGATDPPGSGSSARMGYGLPRHPNPAVERVLRPPPPPTEDDFSLYTSRDAQMMTPPVRPGTVRDGWLMGRDLAGLGRGLGQRVGVTPGESETTFDAPPRASFPLPRPVRRDFYGRQGRRAVEDPATPGTESGMDFTLASYTSPTQPDGRGAAVARGITRPAAAAAAVPPTIESIEREIAYWRRNPPARPGHLATRHVDIGVISPSVDTPPRPPPESIAVDSTHRPGAMTPQTHAPRRADFSTTRERVRASPSDDSMDVSGDGSSAREGVPPSFTRMPRRRFPRGPRIDLSESADDDDDEGMAAPGARYPAHDISDSLVSSDATMERALDRAADAGFGRPRSRIIEEEPEPEGGESREESHGQEGGMELIEDGEDALGSEQEQDDDDDDDDDDASSRASSTRHLHDDELEMLILQKHFGFRGSFAPGSRVGTFDAAEEEPSGSGSGSGSDMDADESRQDAFGSRSIADPPGERKRKRRRTDSRPQRVVFDVEQRRKQWLSEAEDRALRRGPIMGLSLEDFKNDMLEPKEWKQLIDHQLSDTAWKYIPVIGAGFLPHAGLAQVSHSTRATKLLSRPSHPPGGPQHPSMQRSRHVTMAETAAAYEATARGQAGEEYGIRVLPLNMRDWRDPQSMRGDHVDDTEHPNGAGDDTGGTTVGSAGNAIPNEGGYRHGYLEGSFGRLNVGDSHRWAQRVNLGP